MIRHLFLKNFSLIALAAFLFSSATIAQTRVSGKIYDASTREPLPFVNILLKGTKSGTTSDFDGNYVVITSDPTDSIIVSYVGYNRLARPIKRNISQTLNLELEQKAVSLAAIEIKPGENPAHVILRKVIANKIRNDKNRLASYEYEVYNKIEFDMNNIPKEFKDKKLLKPIKFIFDNIDSTNVKLKPYLPLFMTESLSDYYYKRNPRYKKEVIKASKVAGLEDASVAQFTGDMYQNVDIYDNTVLVFSKNFVSPISDNGLLYYRYYLIDSTTLDGNKCYQIQFKPKHRQSLTFQGNMWIADTAFAVKRLEMSIADDANINFINTLNVVQEYKNLDSAWMLSKDKLVIDFAMRERKMGFYGKKTTSYEGFVINKPKEDEFYSRADNLVVEKDATKKTEEFWASVRHDSLSKNEKDIYKMVDTIQSLPIYKTGLDYIMMLTTGYKLFGNFEFGPYYNTLSYNTIEGARLRFGGRTSDNFSKWYELSGYIAYGTRDEAFKYKLGFRSFVTKDPRQLIYMSYKSDYEILGQSQNGFTQDNILASLFRRTPLSSLTAVQEIKAHYEREWFQGFSNKLFFINRTMTPLGDFRYEYATGENTSAFKEHIKTSEVKLFTRFAYDEKFVDGTFSRTSLGTKYPVLQVEYTIGLKDIFNSDYEYEKLVVKVQDRFRINPIGYTDYIIEAGQVFGTVPYPLMELHGGNETYVYDPYAYNLMNYYEFASDKYFTVQAFHHFDGFFLNKIPLLRKLKWREVITGKMLMGSTSEKNRNSLVFPGTLNALTRGPYVEASAGIENIFKIFRFDFLWRLSYLANPNISRYGIRGSIQVNF